MKSILYAFLLVGSSHVFAGGSNGGTPGLQKPSALILDASKMSFKNLSIITLDNKMALLNQKLCFPEEMVADEEESIDTDSEEYSDIACGHIEE